MTESNESTLNNTWYSVAVTTDTEGSHTYINGFDADDCAILMPLFQRIVFELNRGNGLINHGPGGYEVDVQGTFDISQEEYDALQLLKES